MTTNDTDSPNPLPVSFAPDPTVVFWGRSDLESDERDASIGEARFEAWLNNQAAA